MTRSVKLRASSTVPSVEPESTTTISSQNDSDARQRSISVGSPPPWHFQFADGKLDRIYWSHQLGSIEDRGGILEYPPCAEAYERATVCDDIGHPLSMDLADNLTAVDARWRKLPQDDRRPDALMQYCVALTGAMPPANDCIDDSLSLPDPPVSDASWRL